MRWCFLDRVDELIPGERIRGVYSWPAELEIFEDHFPGWPIVPGVLILESLAQLSGKAIGYTVRGDKSYWPFPILSMMGKVKFRKFVRPGQEVQLEADFVALREESAVMAVKARLDGRVMAQAEQFFVFNALPFEDPEHGERLERVEGAELARLWAGFDPKVWNG
jgi:3-hydroxyacyl-[acyl-carrier-protein] dehydratase